MMKRFFWLTVYLSTSIANIASAQNSEPKPTARPITLPEAVQLALKHNHVVRTAAFQVEEKQHAKDVAKSSYFPTLRNDSGVVNLTDTQFIAIPGGSLSGPASSPVPPRTA